MSPGPMLTIVALVALAGLLAVFGTIAVRTGIRPLGLWLLAWTAQLATGVLFLVARVEPTLGPVVYLPASLVAPLMWMGTRAHVGRKVGLWIPVAALAVGATRLAGSAVGAEWVAIALAIAIDPPLAFLCWRLVRSTPQAPRSLGDRLLVWAFAGYVGLELADALLRVVELSRWVGWGLWIGLGLPLFAAQVGVYLRRLGVAFRTGLEDARSHEERLRLLTTAADAVLVEYDALGNLTYVSPNAEERIGRPASAGIGRNAGDYFETRSDSPVERALVEHGRIRESDVVDSLAEPIRAVTRDGTERWYEVARASYRTGDGQLRIVAQARDVTDRVRRQAARDESERRLRRAERIGRFGSWHYDHGTGELTWSEAFHRLHGLEPEEGPVDASKVAPLIDPDDLERMYARFASRDLETEFPAMKYRIRRADDGRERVLETMGEIERDERGRILRVMGASRDITEQEELEAALRRGREHLDLLVSSNVLGVFYADREGMIREANDAFLSLLGYAPSDLPLSWRDLTPTDRVAQDELALAGRDEDAAHLPYEKVFRARSGEPISTLIGSARLEDDLWIVIVIDLSERKRAEAYIERKQRELEETVAARTRELLASRNRLMMNERLAAVGTLAAGVAHQINNPIGAILNSSEYALLCAADPDAQLVFRQALESNLAEARRCARIVRSMLQFSREEPTEKWVEDVSSVIRRAHRAIAAYARDHDATVSIRAPGDPLPALISPIEIEQAVVNVLRNAIEADSRGVSISIALRRRGDRIEIEIVDDGAGIAEEDRDRLFEPFYSTRTRLGGTGLGLSVAHGVVTSHGGTIRIDSELGEGSRVLITLPLHEGGPEAPGPVDKDVDPFAESSENGADEGGTQHVGSRGRGRGRERVGERGGAEDHRRDGVA